MAENIKKIQYILIANSKTKQIILEHPLKSKVISKSK